MPCVNSVTLYCVCVNIVGSDVTVEDGLHSNAEVDALYKEVNRFALVRCF